MNTKFIDLCIQIGKPYYFRHLNSCDHMIVFTDIRYIFSLCSKKLDYQQAASKNLQNLIPN